MPNAQTVFCLLLASLMPAAAAAQSHTFAALWSQLAEFTASDGASGNMLGYSIAKSDNTIVMGAPDAKIGSNADQGAAYVYVEGANGWSDMTQTAKLISSDGGAGDHFGISVYVCHNVIVVGMGPRATGSKAYVYVEPANGWTDMTETAQLTASDEVPGDRFASTVGISLNTIVVGDYENSSSDKGAAYVYEKPVSGWKNMTQTAKLTASDGKTGDLFGFSVSANRGNTVVIGAIQSGNERGGAAYVFLEPANGWKTTSQFNAELTASDRAKYQKFGQAVAANGSTIVVGGKGASGNGTAYVFVEPEAGWTSSTETAQLLNPLAKTTNCYACAVGVSGPQIAVGSPKSASTQGAIYIFNKPSKGWATTTQYGAKLAGSDHSNGALFGTSIGFDTQVAAGAPGGGSDGAGSGYIFGTN
ncbi:MAG TPA: FG-GAP repeat protein [Terriglobales bacterium]